MSLNRLLKASQKVEIKQNNRHVRLTVRTETGAEKVYRAFTAHLAVETACIDLGIPYEGPKDDPVAT